MAAWLVGTTWLEAGQFTTMTTENRNVEWKARARDPERQRQRALQLAGAPPELLEQLDTFFCVANGYLKLRRFSAKRGELIHYLRPVQTGPKLSKYSLVATDQPDGLRDLLVRALGVHGEVRKRRQVFLAGQSRIHFDEVEQLGTFLEVEVVLRPEQSVAEGEQIAAALRRELDVREDELIDVAYLALLMSGS
jgi:adenylate cyclase class IV